MNDRLLLAQTLTDIHVGLKGYEISFHKYVETTTSLNF